MDNLTGDLIPVEDRHSENHTTETVEASRTEGVNVEEGVPAAADRRVSDSGGAVSLADAGRESTSRMPRDLSSEARISEFDADI